MERFNNKLYDKYTNLKKRKLSEASECNEKVRAEFEKYLSVVEGTFEELRNENNQLRAQILSMEDRQAEYQHTLMEETRKVKELSGENERLRNLVSAEDHSNSKTGDMEIVCLEAPNRIPEAVSRDPVEQMEPNLNSGLNELQHEVADMHPHDNGQDELLVPDCCRGNFRSSGGGDEKDCAKCVYQMLVESLIGMKFSVETRTDGFCLSVVHQSSGYSFSLTWPRKTNGEDGELLYQVSSLGTIERVALEWMKEDLVFSTAMCHVFFERISRVTGGRI
uniref:Uncharacterized protein MG328 n=1 Tax=Anthurium amnicola TaxID=1678845 RepID=A0A1D1YH32_9ARAE